MRIKGQRLGWYRYKWEGNKLERQKGRVKRWIDKKGSVKGRIDKRGSVTVWIDKGGGLCVGKREEWVMGKVMGEQSRRGCAKGGSREGWVMGSGRSMAKSG